MGGQFPPVPPLEIDQWLASVQSPASPTQYRLRAAEVLIVHPVLLPKSTALLAVKVAPPLAAISCN